jgi:hypothetical protein
MAKKAYKPATFAPSVATLTVCGRCVVMVSASGAF